MQTNHQECAPCNLTLNRQMECLTTWWTNSVCLWSEILFLLMWGSVNILCPIEEKNCLFLLLDLPWPITLSLILTFCLYGGAHLYVQNSWFFSSLMVEEGTGICIWNSICICVRNRIRVTHKILPVPSHRCDLICQVEKLVPPTPKLSLKLSPTSFVFVTEFVFVFECVNSRLLYPKRVYLCQFYANFMSILFP